MLTDDEPAEPPVEDAGGIDEIAVVDDRPSRRSRLPVLVLVAVVLVATATAYVGWRFVVEDGHGAASTPASAPCAGAGADLDPVPDAFSEPVRDRAAGRRAAAGRPARRLVYLEVTVLESGDLEVDQWVRSSTPLSALRLSVPADALLGDAIVASDLLVTADGAEADVPTSLGTSPADITLPDVHQVHLTYRLSGAVLRSPSRADRALARTVALDLDLNGRATSRAGDDQLPRGHGARRDLRRRRGAGAVRPA